MSRKIAHYTTALLTLSVFAGLYLATVDRWLQSPPVTPLTHRDAPWDLHGSDSMADLFPASAWQRGECKRLRTSRGMLLFQHWEQTSRNEWKLWPITVVVGRGLDEDEAEPPLIIDSVEGARIEFDQSLDIMSGGAPPIRAGEIHGDVRVWRLPRPGAATLGKGAKDSSNDSLEIQTSNLSINERKIWTTQAIRMRIGEALIRGQDLTLEFTMGATQADSLPDVSSLLNRMELIYLHELTMPLSGDATLSVDCGGRVQYDFSQHRLRLGESVTLTHRQDGIAVDRFDCTELELALRDPLNRNLPRNSPSDWLAEVQAMGSPAIARLGSIDCDFAADSIHLDAFKGEIRASGSLGVAIRYGAIRAQLEGLIYSFDPADPTRLGMVDARGRGSVVSSDPELPLRDLRWTDGLLVRNDSGPQESMHGGLLKLWIDGTVEAVLADGDSFRSDAVEGDLRTTAEDIDQGKLATDTRLLGSNLSDRPVAQNWLPERFTAKGDVRVQAAGFDVQTESLQLFFVHRPPAGGLASEAGVGRGDHSRSQASALSRWIGQPAGHASSPAVPSSEAAPPVILRGAVIAAKLELAGSEVVARDLSIHGGVELASRVDASGQLLDARLRGEVLRLRDGSGESLIDLRGKLPDAPARLELGDGYFVGPRVQIWPTAGVVEIDSAGELHLPTAMLPTGLTNGSDEKPGDDRWRWVRPPRCRWDTAMTFDGRIARMLGGVRVDASLVNETESWDLYLTGGALQFNLQREVNLREARTLRDAVLQQVLVLAEDDQRVLVEALRRGADGRLESRHLLNTAQLRLLPLADGRLIGSGPGWYRGWLRDAFWKGNTARSTAQRKADSNAAADPSSELLTGVHLTFNDAMVGELQTRSLEFNRGVRIGVRSVAAWEEAFDVAQMNTIGLEESSLDCERLRVQVDPIATTTPSRSSPRAPNARVPMPIEMVADGGLMFRTRNQNGLYEALASEARYSSAKDRFTVTGSANRVAQFRRTASPGQPSDTLEFDWLILRPDDMTIEDLKWRGVRVGAFPDANRR